MGPIHVDGNEPARRGGTDARGADHRDNQGLRRHIADLQEQGPYRGPSGQKLGPFRPPALTERTPCVPEGPH